MSKIETTTLPFEMLGLHHDDPAKRRRHGVRLHLMAQELERSIFLGLDDGRLDSADVATLMDHAERLRHHGNRLMRDAYTGKPIPRPE